MAVKKIEPKTETQNPQQNPHAEKYQDGIKLAYVVFHSTVRSGYDGTPENAFYDKTYDVSAKVTRQAKIYLTPNFVWLEMVALKPKKGETIVKPIPVSNIGDSQALI